MHILMHFLHNLPVFLQIVLDPPLSFPLYYERGVDYADFFGQTEEV